MLGSLIFIGWAIGCLLIPPYADRKGRKRPFLVSCFVQFFLWFLIATVRDINIYYVLCFVWGFLVAGRYTVGYVLLVESVPQAYQVKIGLLVDITESFSILYATFYLKFISKNWLYFQMLGMTSNFVGFFLCLCFVQESPRFLLANRRYEKLFFNLKKLANYNGKLLRYNVFMDKYNNIKDQEISKALAAEDSKSVKASNSLYEGVKKDKIMRFNLLIMLYAWCATSVSFYINGLMLKYVKGDMYLNVFGSIMAEVVALLIAGALSVNFGLKLSIVSSYAVAFAGALLLFVFQSIESMIPVFLILLRFGLGSSFGVIYLANIIFPVEYAT